MNSPTLTSVLTLSELGDQLASLLPAVIIAITALVVMLLIAIKRNHFWTATTSVLGLNAALITLLAQVTGYLAVPAVTTSLFAFDGFAMINGVVVLITALACTSLAYGYFESFDDQKEELYLLMLISTLGAILMVAAQHLAAFFVALELLSVPMYGLVAYAFSKQKSLEAGMKYLVLSAAASATLLMGMALVYADTGSMSFDLIGRVVLERSALTPLIAIGSALMLAAVAFKLSLAPFHSWAGDVYEGAPTPMTAFLASTAKVAMMALVIRFLIDSALPAISSVNLIITWLIVLSILIGNLLALKQDNLKRLFAYSAIAHMGYAMIGLMGIGGASDGLITMYMAVYALTSLAAFGVVTVVTGTYRNHRYAIDEASKISHYRGLFWQRPILTAVLTVMVLSMAGIPLTAGFITKFQVVLAAVQGGRFGLAAMLIVGSAIGLYYYLRILLMLYKRPAKVNHFATHPNWGLKVGGVMLIFITVLIFGLGVLPEGLFRMATMANMG